jgi:hypothetical protein
MFGSLPCRLVGDFGVLPFQDVRDLGPVAEGNLTGLAGVNVLNRNLNPCSFLGWTENIPDLPFRNRKSWLFFGIDHFDHFVSRSLVGMDDLLLLTSLSDFVGLVPEAKGPKESERD